MADKIFFTKMHGIGNDYVYVNGFKQKVDDPGQLAKKISDRHFGVGSDGLVMILPSEVADVRMRMFNSDGTEAEMCGNATRCVGKYAYDSGLVSTKTVSLETLAGIKTIDLAFDADKVVGATVDMGEPELMPEKIPVIATRGQERFVAVPVIVSGREYLITAVSMGNPHAIVFMDGVDALDLPKIGPAFENHELFPRRTNTEFVEILSSDRVKMRVWERGAGETLACGTGACAVAVACVLNGRTGRSVDVELLGGTLHIEWQESDNHVYMTGGAETVFEGEYFV